MRAFLIWIVTGSVVTRHESGPELAQGRQAEARLRVLVDGFAAGLKQREGFANPHQEQADGDGGAADDAERRVVSHMGEGRKEDGEDGEKDSGADKGEQGEAASHGQHRSRVRREEAMAKR